MSASELEYYETFIFYGTKYDVWKLCMLNLFRRLGPLMEQNVVMGFSPIKDPQNWSSEDWENLCLDQRASIMLHDNLSDVVVCKILPYRYAHELWTKLQDKYDVSKSLEDCCSPTTSGLEDLSSSSTSPTCDLSQGNYMVSGDIINVNLAIYTNDHPSTNASGVDSLDLNTSCNKGVISFCVDSSCMSSRTHLYTIVDDMRDMSHCHDHNASISSSCLPTNIVEENKHSMGQDKIMDGDSRFSSSSFSSDKCLMAREENVISSTHTPIVTPSNHKLKNIDMLINDDDDVTAHDKLMKFCASTRGVSRSMFKY
jgi:hypothetical protein